VLSDRPTRPVVDEHAYRDKIARRVRSRRVWLGLSQEQLATKAGVTRNFVSAIERECQGLDVWRLRQLADAMEVSLFWLLDGADERSGGS
jgi:ribosome-binding protein aMBF1 (putative translation factor)